MPGYCRHTIEDSSIALIAIFTDLERLLEEPQTIKGKAMKVLRQLSKKKIPPDPVKVHVQGISEKTTEDCLRFYLEKFSDAEVVEVFLGSNNDALATFESEPGNFESVLVVFKIAEIIKVRSLAESEH